ncbi:uncharacterized protein LOC111268163 [Varroa jacobsoni]|uniref:uncharacterized protein LOC111268163 n=1 Tax=Varroa jacobsoni TaxID=62625 RepID=UPI000BF3DDEC|nr:uncharacterized protein LOC111268163 [Varroa jacobsoni]
MFALMKTSVPVCCVAAVIATFCHITITIAELADSANNNTSSVSSITASQTSNEALSTTTGVPKPRCPGTCHGSVMSLFCEHVDTMFGCPEGEFCCIRRPTTPTPPTTEAEIPECKGFCIPYFLSGLCYRPARLILRTINCEQETLCCDNTPASLLPILPDDSENEMRRSRFW